ncbi:Bug family tripartite tricarboxylate transporter substrate binding protein [Pollutimonas bauzanensis]|nr:tripartite tricarboxylate transporter substrate binding protein [Pollutimonas bauzanensis]
MARLVAQKMSAQLKQSVIVENKPGASAQIGASYVANSAPDGYTLLVDAASFSINPNLYPKLPYDGIKAFVPVGVLARFPSVIVVTPSFSAQSLADLIGLAKAEPGGVFYASAGNGSAQNLGTVLFMEKAGIKLEQIPYKGGGPAMTDVMGGQVPMYFANVASSIAHIKAGKLRALAVTGSTRAEALPDVPTLKEAGVVDAESYEWNGMFAPKGTPPEIVDKLALALEQALDSPSVSDRIKELGGQRLPGGREAAVKFVQEQSDRAGEIIRHNNIKVD